MRIAAQIVKKNAWTGHPETKESSRFAKNSYSSEYISIIRVVGYG